MTAFFAIRSNRVLSSLALLLALLGQPADRASAQSEFTYQGQLTLHGSPVDASCSMQFRLFDAGTSGNLLDTIGPRQVDVRGGVFTTLLDFGADNLGDGDRWLEISVDCGTGLIQLSPRQAITSTPYAMRAVTAENPAVRVFEFAVTSSSWDDGAASGGSIVYGYRLPASLTGGKTLREWFAEGAVILGYAWTPGALGYKQMPHFYRMTRTPSDRFPETFAGIRIELLPDLNEVAYFRTLNGFDGIPDWQGEENNEKPRADIRIVIIGPN